MKNTVKIVLGLVAMTTLLVGLQGFFDPQAIMDNVQTTLDNNSALSSTRANYGGMHIAFGIMFLLGALSLEFRRPALWVLALYTTGYGAGRLYSLLVDGAPNTFIGTWVFVEIGLAVFAWVALRYTPAALGERAEVQDRKRTLAEV